MRAAGIAGVRRGKRVRTTKPDPAVVRHPDLVGRDFTATAPNQLWVTDLTFVPTWPVWPTSALSPTRSVG
jgi:putative transposase